MVCTARGDTPHILQVNLNSDPAFHQSTAASQRKILPSWALKLNDGDKKVYLLVILATDLFQGGEDEAEIPVCPAFEEIGLRERFSAFDPTMIHIWIHAVLIVFRDADDCLGREI